MYFLRLLLVSTTFISAIAKAEDPFACVDPNVRVAFMDHFRDLRNVYSTEGSSSTVLPEFPSEWDLVGTHSHPRGEQIVYTSENSVNDAADQAISIMVDAGWTYAEYQSPFGSGGFRMSETPRNAEFCSPDKGHSISLTTIKKNATVFVSVSHRADQGQCQPGASDMYSSRLGLRQEIPLLLIDEALVKTMRPAGSGGGGDSYGVGAALFGLSDRSMLFADLNRQLADQQWIPQGDWASDRSAGSAWFRETASGEPRVGLLHAIRASDDATHISFTIQSVAELAKQGMGAQWMSSLSLQSSN